MKNFIIPLLFLGAFFITINCNCNKDEDCIKDYKFQIPFNLTPQIDTFKIGDTIWVSSDFSNEIKELNYSEPITLKDFDFRSELTIEKISVDPFQNANLEFDIIEKQGNLNLIPLIGTSTFLVEYDYVDDTYKVDFGFVPQGKGLYTLVLSSLITEDSESLSTRPDCKEEIKSIEYLLNGGENNNYEFISQSADSLIRTTTKDIYDEYGQYSFYVIE